MYWPVIRLLKAGKVHGALEKLLKNGWHYRNNLNYYVNYLINSYSYRQQIRLKQVFFYSYLCDTFKISLFLSSKILNFLLSVLIFGN